MFSGLSHGMSEAERLMMAKVKRTLRAKDCLRVSVWMAVVLAYERLTDLTKAMRRGIAIGPIVNKSV